MCVSVRNSLLCKVCIHFFNKKKSFFFNISWAKHYTRKKMVWSVQLCMANWVSGVKRVRWWVSHGISQRGFASLNSRAEKKSIWILVVSGTRKFIVHHYKSHTIAIVYFIYTFSRLLVCVMNAMHLKSYIYRFGDGLWKRTTNEQKKNLSSVMHEHVKHITNHNGKQYLIC